MPGVRGSRSTPAARGSHFEHGADIGVRGVAPTKEGAFEQAAAAMFSIMTDLQTVRPGERIEVDCEAPDEELLLVEWLNALISEAAVRHMFFARFQVRIDGTRLRGSAWGEPIDLARHQPGVEVKGATYTALSVRQESSAWTAQCVVDV